MIDNTQKELRSIKRNHRSKINDIIKSLEALNKDRGSIIREIMENRKKIQANSDKFS